MAINIEDQNQKTPGNGKMIVGLLLLVLGIGFLFQQLDMIDIPHYLFGWPTWIIFWGLFIGARHNFRNSAWFILVIIGMAGLLDDAIPGIHLDHVFWPLAIIGFGVWLILKRNNNWDKKHWGQKWEDKWDDKWNTKFNKYGNPYEQVITPVTPVTPTDPEGTTTPPPAGSTSIPPVGSFGGNPLKGDDYLDAVSIFGGVKKTIFSKNFRGGEIVNIFGGAELDFTQADINGRIIIDITQIFGGTKIIVPSNWQVVSDMAAVFASVDDKRIKTTVNGDSNKVLVLKGVSIFAGVEVRSY